MRQQTIYDESWYAKDYDDDRFGRSFGHHLHDQEVETYLSMINGSHGRILDVGAGTGKLSVPLLRQSRPVISIDMSSQMLGIARRKAEQEGMILDSVICDAHHLCFRDNSFECVVSSRLLMHLSDYRQGISELCRVAQLVVIDFPPLLSFGGLDSIFKKFTNLFVANTVRKPYKVFLIRSVIRELQRHNFQIGTLKRQFFLPILFHRWLNRPRFSLSLEKACRMIGLVRMLGVPVTVSASKRAISGTGGTSGVTASSLPNTRTKQAASSRIRRGHE